jgi:ABC-2 type transport system ATP-binding protein
MQFANITPEAVPMLELQHLYRSFRGIPAIEDVSFQVAPGEIVGFLGPNGAGKSTTVKIITGMLRPNDGRVLFAGQDIAKDMVAFRAALGYVPEEAHLYDYLSGLEYLQLVGRLRGLGEALIEAKATRLLKLLNLESWQYSPISTYSKGMRQRVLIAAALLHDPKLLIFDEPLSGLDVVSGRLFKDLLELLAAQGKAVLYISAGLQPRDRHRQGQGACRCSTRRSCEVDEPPQSGKRFCATGGAARHAHPCAGDGRGDANWPFVKNSSACS